MDAPLLSITALHKSFGPRPLCIDASLAVQAGERIGLIGDNGTGKSTFLKMVAGLEPADGGTVSLRSGVRVALMPQATHFSAATAGEVLAEPFAAVQQAIADYERAAVAQQDVDDALARIEGGGGWDWQRHVERAASLVGMTDLSAEVARLSGGQKKRLAIGRLMLERPDLVLLDEPTNHLDTETVEWLEGWLCQSGLAAIVVTHDRYFLEAVVDRMAELRHGKLRTYEGAYSDYIAARASEEALEARSTARLTQLLKGEAEWASRAPKARGTKAQARLDRFAAGKASLAAAPKARVAASLAIQRGPRLGKTILELREVVAGFAATRPLFTPFDFKLQAGERWGIVGANGMGKTSLLRLVDGTLEPLAGQVVRGKNTVVAVFDQFRTNLRTDQLVQQFLVPEGGDTVFVEGAPVHVSSYLQRFAFPPQAHTLRISQLSGGEKNRLALAQYLLTPANVLLLDEPTNDLDILTLSVLEDALQRFTGCVLVVSHDRYFLDKVCTGIVAFEPAAAAATPPTLQTVQGDWSHYVKMQAKRVAAAQSASGSKKPQQRAKSAHVGQAPSVAAPAARLTHKEKLELAAIEAKIEAADAEVVACTAALEDPALWQTDAKAGQAAAANLKAAQKKSQRLFERWETLAAKADT